MHISEAVRALDGDLRSIVGDRLQSLVVFAAGESDAGAPAHTLAVVDRLSADDLAACAARVDGWHDGGLATPLLLTASEFSRALDAFPLEFGAILADHLVVSGASPFRALRVDPADLRRALERQARGHLLHLREGFLETRGRGDRIAELILRSAPSLAALVKAVALHRGLSTNDASAAAQHVEAAAALEAGAIGAVMKLASGGSLSPDEARRIFPRYLNALDKLTSAIDAWRIA